MSPKLLIELERLPALLSDHILITMIPLLIGIITTIPLAIYVAKKEKFKWITLSVISVIQTIPSLALLALMVPLLAITSDYFNLNISVLGFIPALMALTLYSLLPIIRNTLTGLSGVDPALTEAARGVGMSPWQSLKLVELPLATPIIIAGIRTSAVWVVGTATLATPVGQNCLGNFIFSGLQTRNWTSVMVGVVSAALLALILDYLIGLLEKGFFLKSKLRKIIGGLGLVLLFGIGIYPSMGQWFESEQRQSEETIIIGGKTFTEQYILMDVLQKHLQPLGFQSEKLESLGSTVAFDALVNDQIHVYIDYSGTIWANAMKRNQFLSRRETITEVKAWLKKEHGILLLGSLGFENTYAMAVRSADRKEFDLESIEDLTLMAPRMKMGGDYEFFSRPEWQRLKETYNLNFNELKTYDSTFMYEALANKDVDVITAFSSDGRIAAYNLELLEDTRRVFPPYDAILLISPDAQKIPGFVDALRPLIRSISIEDMQEANQLVDIKKRSPGRAADWLLENVIYSN